MSTDAVLRVVSKRLPKVDGAAIVKGAPHYTMDMVPPGALHAKLLRSPRAHARIKSIDREKAMALPGVLLVLTHEDVPRVPFTTAGQNFPEPSPYDTVMLDNKVRFVGDRVAVVVATDEVSAQKGCECLKVEYEDLPAVFDAREALKEGAPLIHDETDSQGIHDAARNLAARIEVAFFISMVSKVSRFIGRRWSAGYPDCSRRAACCRSSLRACRTAHR